MGYPPTLEITNSSSLLAPKIWYFGYRVLTDSESMSYVIIVGSCVLWIPVAILKIVLALIGLFVVPICLRLGEPTHLWQKGAVPDWWLTMSQNRNVIAQRFPRFWWWAIRNPVSGFGSLISPRGTYRQWGSITEPHQTDLKWQWRFRLSGLLSSFRCVWKYSKTRYGELYLGWKLGSTNWNFAMQLRRGRIGEVNT